MSAPEWRDVAGLRRDAEQDTGSFASLVLRLLDTTPALPARAASVLTEEEGGPPNEEPRTFQRSYPAEPDDVTFVRGVVAPNGATWERFSPDVWVPTKGRGGYTWRGLLDAYPSGLFALDDPEQIFPSHSDEQAARSTSVTGQECTCTPCESPGRGHPGIEHCAACCGGSLIEEYDHACPEAEHREMAERQFPSAAIIRSTS